MGMPDKKINIQLIVEGCRNGNRNSQRILFEYFMGYALGICLRYAHNRVEAEEILNDGFLKVFRKIDQYDPAFPFRAWLRKIMINSAIDYFRSNKNKPTFIPLHAIGDVEDDSPTPFLPDPESDLLPILQKLSPNYRLVFNLAIMEGYKHHEIAELLGISASTSRSNLVRAKQKLRSLMRKEYGFSKKFPS